MPVTSLTTLTQVNIPKPLFKKGDKVIINDPKITARIEKSYYSFDEHNILYDVAYWIDGEIIQGNSFLEKELSICLED